MTYLNFGVLVTKEQQRNTGDNADKASKDHAPADLYYPNPDAHERFVAAIKESMKQDKD
jgi:hypothetical protein